MKRALKIIGISLGSILGVAIAAVCVAIWFVFTPQKLTPIVKSYIPDYVTCQTDLDTVDVTFFSTFPHFGIRIHDLALINPMDGAQSDTVAYIEDFVATVDVKEYLSNNNVVINGFNISNTRVNIYVNADTVANYDVFVTDTAAEEDTTSSELFNILNIRNVSVSNVTATYVSIPDSMRATIRNIQVAADAEMNKDDLRADVTMQTDDVAFLLIDSSKIIATADGVKVLFNGDIQELNDIVGTVDLTIDDFYASMQGVDYADSLALSAKVPLQLSLDSLQIAVMNAVVGINQHKVSLTGDADLYDDIRMNMNFATNELVLRDVISLIPEDMQKEYLDGISIDGLLHLTGNVRGIYNDTLMPFVSVDATYSNGNVSVEGLGHDLYDVGASVHAQVDLNEEKNSSLKINSVSVKTGKSSLTATGDVSDLLNDMDIDIKATAKVFLLDLKQEVPEDVFVSGWVDAVVSARGNLDQFTNADLTAIKADGNVILSDLDIVYEDSLFVKSDRVAVDFALPSPQQKTTKFHEIMQVNANTETLHLSMLEFMDVGLKKASVSLGLPDVMDTTKDLAVACDYAFSNVDIDMPVDTISATLRNPKGSVMMYPQNKNTGYVCAVRCDSLYAKVADLVSTRTGLIDIDAKAEYNEQETDMILQWNPDVKVSFNQGQFAFADIEKPIKISAIQCDFNKSRLKIDRSQLIVGNSDFELQGIIKNIEGYLKDEDLLKGELAFTSNYTDVNELMDIVSGFGDTTEVVEDTSLVVETISPADTTILEKETPFMVPLGVDIVLNTDIKKALVGETIIDHVGGGVTVRDGVLVLEEMGFTCDAAQMQLTAMYRSDRVNHLFTGLDFHLIDISIADLIDMIPDIDTIVPMLKSFSGKAEFHFAAETYLKSNYDPKFSTLRGAAAIKGKDLVVMDNETYQQISKILLFNKKKTKNVIDSLSVEMTMFRNEVDLYPFVVSMDKYQAVLSGYHNLDMTYNYHISLTKSPLPFRLGLNILGTVDDLKFKLARCKYKKLYKPERREVVDEQILALKKTISSSLQAGVKNQDALIKD